MQSFRPDRERQLDGKRQADRKRRLVRKRRARRSAQDKPWLSPLARVILLTMREMWRRRIAPGSVLKLLGRGVRPGLISRIGPFPLLLCLFSLLLGLGALQGSWVYDDFPLIAQNPKVTGSEAWWEIWSGSLWSNSQLELGENLSFYRPWMLLSFRVDFLIFGEASWGFHLHQLLLHVGIVALLYGLLRRLGKPERLSLLLSLLFACHPARAETVAWLSARADLLVLLGLLLASHGLLNRLESHKLSWLEGLGLGLAFLSKEHALVLPAFGCLLAAQYGRQDSEGLGKLLGRGLRQSWGWSLALVIYGGLRAWLLPLREFDLVGLRPGQHLAWVLETFGRAHYLLTGAGPLSLDAQRLHWNAQGLAVQAPWAWLGAGLLCMYLLAGVLSWRKPKLALFALGLACTLGSLLPVCQIMPSGEPTMLAPRMLGLPLLGLLLSLSFLPKLQICLPARRAWLWAFPVALVLAYSWRFSRRCLDFRSDQHFRAAELREGSPLALYGPARQAKAEGRYRRCRELATAALGLSAAELSGAPERPRLLELALESEAHLLLDDERESLHSLALALELLPRPDTLLSYERGDFRLNLAPSTRLRRALARSPSRIYLLQAETWARLGEDLSAAQALDRAVSSAPRTESVLLESARLWTVLGELRRTQALLLRRALLRGESGLRPEDLQMLARAQALKQAQQAPYPERLWAQTFDAAAAGMPGRAHSALAELWSEHESYSPEQMQFLARLALRGGNPKLTKLYAAELTPKEVQQLRQELEEAPAHAESRLLDQAATRFLQGQDRTLQLVR